MEGAGILSRKAVTTKTGGDGGGDKHDFFSCESLTVLFLPLDHKAFDLWFCLADGPGHSAKDKVVSERKKKRRGVMKWWVGENFYLEGAKRGELVGK